MQPTAITTFVPRAALLAVALGMTLAGCGQKGPLYLPDDGTTQTESDAATDSQTQE